MATSLVRIQNRRKTAAAWTAANEVLLQGEFGVETDTSKYKVGDGSTTWTLLKYAGVDDASVAAIVGNSGATRTALDARYASLASPTFTGSPAAPTATSGDSSTKVATTAFVAAAIAGVAAGSATLAPGTGGDVVEGADFHSDGHSYGVAGINGTNQPRTTWFQRASTRLRSTSYTNRNVSGAQAPDCAGVAAANAPMGFHGVILWDCTINDANRDGATGTITGFQNGLKTWLLIRRAAAKFEAETYATETGTWTTVTDSYASGGTARQTVVQNSAHSYAVSGATNWFVLLGGGVGASNGGTAAIAVDGTTVATVNLASSYAATQNNTSRTWFPLAVPVTVPNASSHTITVTKSDAGSGAVIVDAIFARAVAAPLIVLAKAIYPSSGASSATVNTYNAAIDAVAATVATDGTIVTIDPQAAGFTASTMTIDGLHPSNYGAAFISSLVVNTIRAITATNAAATRLGVDYNGSTVSGAAVATPGAGTPALTNTGAPVASGSTSVGSVLSVTNGTWSATPDSYTYQWKRAGSAISGATSSTYTTVSGDAGQAITCTVTAMKSGYTNGIATSNTITIASGGGGGPLASDNFNRADSNTSLGTATTGQTWTPLASGAVFGIVSNQAAWISGGTEPSTAVDVGTADIDMTLTIAAGNAGGGQGPVFRATDGSNYLLVDGGFFYRRTGGNFQQIGAINGNTASGNVIRVVAKGSAISITVNGGTAATFTETFNQTATKHGFRLTGLANRVDDISISAAP